MHRADDPITDAEPVALDLPASKRFRYCWLFAVIIAAALLWIPWSQSQSATKAEIDRLATLVDSLGHELRIVRLRVGVVQLDYPVRGIDFSDSALQDIGDGFYVGASELEEHLSGIRIKGELVNATSVVHRGATFRAALHGEEREFTVSEIRPGGSSAFEVYVPEVPAEEVRTGRIKYVRSMVHYQSGT